MITEDEFADVPTEELWRQFAAMPSLTTEAARIARAMLARNEPMPYAVIDPIQAIAIVEALPVEKRLSYRPAAPPPKKGETVCNKGGMTGAIAQVGPKGLVFVVWDNGPRGWIAIDRVERFIE